MTHLRPVAALDIGPADQFLVAGARLYAYASRGSEGRVVVVEIGEPAAPAITARLPDGLARKAVGRVARAGDELVLAESYRALHAVDAATLAPRALFPLLGRDVAWAEGPPERFVVAIDGSGLVTFDLRPATPRVLHVLELAGSVADALRVDASTILVATERGGIAVVGDDGGALREVARHDAFVARRFQRIGDAVLVHGWSDAVRVAPIAAPGEALFEGDVEGLDDPRLATTDGGLLVWKRSTVATWARGGAVVPSFERQVLEDGGYREVPIAWNAEEERYVRVMPEGDETPFARAEAIAFAQRVGDHLFALEGERLVVFELPPESLLRAASGDASVG